ncbi:stalk domain-containing protein [Paenibacillus abyssi]|uniref:stalk domain-containing protein n=1 Tax=Paenibacillus abyssi TaxID=1340531 RepID=UPI00361245D2
MLPANVEKVRTLVPMRFVSEALGEEVVWDHVNRYVWIGHKNVPKLEDAVEAVEIKPFLKYFKGTDSELVLFNRTTQKQHTKVCVIKEMDFPVSIDGEIYYRMDLATTATGYVYTRASTNDNTGTMGTSTYLLQTGQPLKLRGEAAGMREKHGDITLHNNLIASRVDKSRYQNQRLGEASHY